MDILDIARQSGLTVTLEARIGTQEYNSVHGSVDALERFVELVATSLEHDPRRQD
ncbi:hypothetical protein [Burkholderia guangdongensis]|uniref:hypothetical protein n=1 Tax=Burkholderia guangdongensis TaxID=1792500 RepID=UPI0015CAA8FA|nr:hypothetical protein [Burkholderia guangdongensis]